MAGAKSDNVSVASHRDARTSHAADDESAPTGYSGGRLVDWLDRTIYPSYSRNWDNQFFREIILPRLKPADHLLDVGAGAGIVSQMDFKGQVEKVTGIDCDCRVMQNPFLDEAHICLAEDMNLEDASVDVAVASNVLEHVANPRAFLAQVVRVLKPGGLFLAKTPSKWHYMPTIARVTPHGFHQWYNAKRGRKREDTFPTFYYLNSERAVKSAAEAVGLKVEQILYKDGRPEYLRLHAVTYLAGALYERTVCSTEMLRRFRAVLVVVLRKPHPQSMDGCY